MARKPRIHYPGACYHVICRGNQGPRIFWDDADYHAYLQLLQAGVARYGRIMAWVGRDVGDLTIHAMAKALGQDPGGLSRGLRRLAEEMRRDQDLQTTVQMLCETLRKGRRYKTSISHA